MSLARCLVTSSFSYLPPPASITSYDCHTGDLSGRQLEANPNVYVVLIDRTSHWYRDNRTISRGIGESSDFRGVHANKFQEPDGVLFMVYFKSDEGRKMFMRAESLPDQLHVGEANFASRTGDAYELLKTFRGAIYLEGKAFPEALEVVIKQINGTIDKYVETEIAQATQQVQQLSDQLDKFPVTATNFQATHASDGTISRPDLKTWQQQLNTAKVALENYDLKVEKEIGDRLGAAITVQTVAMAEYDVAPQLTENIHQALDKTYQALLELPVNNRPRNVHELIESATQALETSQTQYESGDINFWPSLQAAQDLSNQAYADLRNTEDRQRATHAMTSLGLGLLVLLLGAGASLTSQRIQKEKQQLQQEAESNSNPETVDLDELGAQCQIEYDQAMEKSDQQQSAIKRMADEIREERKAKRKAKAVTNWFFSGYDDYDDDDYGSSWDSGDSGSTGGDW